MTHPPASDHSTPVSSEQMPSNGTDTQPPEGGDRVAIIASGSVAVAVVVGIIVVLVVVGVAWMR